MKAKILSLLRQLDDFVHENFGPIRVTFYVMNDFGLTCQLPLIKKMVVDTRFKVTVTSREPIALDEQLDAGFLQKYCVSYSHASWLKAHYVIYTDVPDLYLRRNHISISTSHGAAFGNNDYCEKSSCHPDFDIIFGPSQKLKEKIEIYQPGTISNDSKLFFSTGFMKCDALFGNTFDDERLLAEHALDPSKKTILIASHWTTNSILRTLGVELARNICETHPDINVIQTAHDKLWSNPNSDGVEHETTEPFRSDILINQLKNLEVQHANFRFIPTSQIQPLLSVADIFITDLSSVIIEYCAFNRPVLFYNPPSISFSDPHTYDLYKNASDSFTHITEVGELVEFNLETPENNRVGRKELIDYFLDHQGTATNTTIDIIKKMGRMSSRNSKRWKAAIKFSNRGPE